jgi:hypothetical protein
MGGDFTDSFVGDMEELLLQRIQNMQQVIGLRVSICNNRIYLLGCDCPI